MILQLENVYKNYTQGKEPVPVLKDICLSVDEGEYIAIMGPSGSGKTTLMNVLGCLDVPTSGRYILDGREIGSLTDDQLADIRNQSIGFVFQSFYLLPKMNALDNVALPLLYRGVGLKERRERAKEALKMVGLEDRMDFRPNQLSGGQSQRVAIARAMVGRPRLLLADEPTGALDTVAGQQIMEIFRELSNQGITIIMITHEPDIAARADKIYRILDGRLMTEPVPVDSWDEEAEEDADESTAEVPEDSAGESAEEIPEDNTEESAQEVTADGE